MTARREIDPLKIIVVCHIPQFQLHLPRYSSKAILKARLLTAVQNAGTRGDAGGGASKQTFEDLEVTIPVSTQQRATYVLQTSSCGVGHRESLRELCARECTYTAIALTV